METVLTTLLGTFWTESMLHNAAKELTGKRDVNDLIIAVKNEKSPARDQLKKLRKLHVVANHRYVHSSRIHRDTS